MIRIADFWEYSHSDDFSGQGSAPEPSLEADGFLADLASFISEEEPSALRLNRPRGHYFTAPEEWLAIAVPDGLRHALWNVHPHFTELRGQAVRNGVSRIPRKETDGHVRSMLALLKEHADHLKRDQEGGILHKATIIHPRTAAREELDILLVELPLPLCSDEMDDTPAHRFTGLLEVRDRKAGKPLKYGTEDLLVPPGFPTHEEFFQTCHVLLD